MWSLLPVKRMLIITKEEEKRIVQDEWNIEVLPVGKWLMM
jgi:hypothetical protein